MTAPPSALAPSRPATPGAFGALYRLILRHQLTSGRLVLFAAILGLSALLGAVIGANADDRVEAAVGVVSVLGLGLVVPIVPLVLATATLGNWVDDETLVYVWLRPVARWKVALAATLAAATVALPVVVTAMAVLSGLASGGDVDAVVASAVASAIGALAYAAVFVLVGLLLRRALLWGLVYVFIWEFVVARAGAGAARFSINSYAASLLSRMTEVELPLADRALWTSYAVPLAAVVAAVALTTWRLHRADVA